MHLILWIVAAIAVGTYITEPIVDPDLWWHITVGRWIVSHGAIPSVDLWNEFGAGKPWRAYSWSNEVVFALFDNHFGPHGLLTLKLLLAAGLALTFFWVFGKLARDWVVGGLLGIFATAACFNHFTLRPQSLVWILFALLLFLINELLRSGMKRNLLLAMAAVMCVWANTQITTVIGVGTAVGWFLVERRVREALIVGAVSVGGTLITPYFGGEWLTFFSKSSHPFALRLIAEFQPATIMQYSTAFVLLAGAVVLLFAHLRPTLLSVGALLLGGGYVLAALAVVKFIPFAAIFLCALAALQWGRASEQGVSLGNLGEGVVRLRSVVLVIPKEGLTFVLLALIIVNVVNLWRAPIASVIPVAAVDFIQEQKLPLPLLNDFGRGGYVMYRFADRGGDPGYKVPIDGRTNVTPHEVWEKYIWAELATSKWQQYLELVKPRTILWRRESPFITVLHATNEWCQVFSSGDDESGYVVLVKRAYFEAQHGRLTADNCSASADIKA